MPPFTLKHDYLKYASFLQQKSHRGPDSKKSSARTCHRSFSAEKVRNPSSHRRAPALRSSTYSLLTLHARAASGEPVFPYAALRAARASIGEMPLDLIMVWNGRTAITLPVTHNFLLEICATPPRVVALRPSILHAGRPASRSFHTSSLRSYVRNGRIELPPVAWEATILPLN